eukprot:1657012-Lingulodinium_polyedra.AAC.1
MATGSLPHQRGALYNPDQEVKKAEQLEAKLERARQKPQGGRSGRRMCLGEFTHSVVAGLPQ